MTIRFSGSFYFDAVWLFVYFWRCAPYSSIGDLPGYSQDCFQQRPAKKISEINMIRCAFYQLTGIAFPITPSKNTCSMYDHICPSSLTASTSAPWPGQWIEQFKIMALLTYLRCTLSTTTVGVKKKMFVTFCTFGSTYEAPMSEKHIDAKYQNW